jgi:1-acyl-sn-glycerol-3-phosphate acyltransferase
MRLRRVRLVETFALQWLAARHAARRLGPEDRARLVGWLARRTLGALDVRLAVSGGLPPDGEPMLIVANHVSWLDVFALNAVCPARFVAKVETRDWPLAGTIARNFGAVFIRRESPRDAARVKDVVAGCLRRGERVAVFPEATTTDGTRLLRFRPAMFQAARDAGVRVQPVAIRYPAADGTANPAPAFVDDMTFVDSLRRLLREPSVDVELDFAAPIRSVDLERRDLAALARGAVAAALRLPRVDVEPDPVRRRPAPARRRLRLAS